MPQYIVRRHVVTRHMKPAHATPLSEAVTLILLSLADQPRHGYAMLKDIEALSDGRVVMSTGTLYTAIRRLLDEGWIDRYEEAEASRERIAYRLTPEGKRRLQAEASRMKRLAQLTGQRMREA